MPDEVMKLVEELEAGLEGVTDGPWRVNHGGEFAHYCRLFDASGNEVARTQWDKGLNAHRNIAWLRICSPDNIRKLIAAIKSRPRPSEEVVEALPSTVPYVDRIVRIFRDKPLDDGSVVVLQDYAHAALSAIPHTGGVSECATEGWQSMDTAPKDGSDFLVAYTDGTVRVGFYLDNSKLQIPWQGYRSRYGAERPGNKIEKWMSLPSALSGDA